MKRTIFLSLIMLSNIHLFAVWDFDFCAGVNPIQVTIQSASIPFEGHNNANLPGFNRPIGLIFNGYKYRRFDANNNYFQKNITYHQYPLSASCFRLHSCFYETPPNGEFDMWGFAKYLITVVNTNNPSETFRFYWNSLDSKMGTDSWQGRDYHCDWSFEVVDNIPTEHYISIFSEANEVERVYLSQQYKEIKLWKLLYPTKPNPEEPWEKNFQARTTPFPITPEAFFDPLFLTSNFELGTIVTIDNIYNNTGSQDRYGYNTVIDYPRNYYTNPPIPAGETNVQGKTVTTPGWPDAYDDFLNLTAESGNKLILKPDIRLWITGTLSTGGDKIQFKSGSTLRLEANSEIRCCFRGQLIIDEGAVLELNNPSYQYCHQASIIRYNGGTHTINNGGTITILSGGTLELTAGTKTIFDGSSSKLKLNSGSTVKLGQGASIEFKNGAYLDAYGSTFSPLNSGDVWDGIKFDKSGADNITYCTFTGTNTYIEVLNDAVSSGNKKTITGNTFNNGLVRLENISKCSISDNNFNSPTGSNDLLQITNNIPFSPASWNLHIINNWFTGGGNFQLNLRGYSGNIPSFYIFNNRFQGGAVFGMYCYNISGSLKYSNFTSSDYSVGLDMANSSLDLYGNVIKSTGSNTIWVKPNSTARLAPVASGAFTPQLEWYGGVNKITSVSSNCVYFQPNGQVLTDRGSNCFNLGNLSNFHIIGDYSSGNCSGFTYYTTRNLWNEGCSPNFNITCNQNQAAVEYNPCISICPSTGNPAINQIGSYITSVGDNIFDTLLITTDFGSGEGGGESGSNSSEIRKSANEDRALYSQILRNKRDKEYLPAIIKCKNIINDYDTSKYVNPSLDELYQNYQNIDTSGSTLMLFTELKSYIEQKMQQYELNTSFVEKAYGYFLKCLIKIGLYMGAIAGYENIMNNHPDATVRLFACWDRAAVVLLLGHGGGQSDMFMKDYEQKIKRLFDKNPAHKIAKDIFEKTGRINKSEFPDDYVKETKDEDSKITERVSRFNPSSIKELEEKMANDNNLLLELSIKRNVKQHVLNIPKIFKLHQNYPNPFNPVTTIKYDIPRDNLVTIKIYDILGKEIFSSSEFRKAGSYEVKFDGTNFASGMYFYSLEAGNFRDTKKMVLLK